MMLLMWQFIAQVPHSSDTPLAVSLNALKAENGPTIPDFRKEHFTSPVSTGFRVLDMTYLDTFTLSVALTDLKN